MLRKKAAARFSALLVMALVTIISVASAEETQSSQAAGNTQVSVAGDGNSVTSVGAQAVDGSYNTAVGISIVVVNGSDNVVNELGTQTIGGIGNTAIGYDALVVSGDRNTATGFGAIAGGGNNNTAIGRRSIAFGEENTAVGYGAQATGSGSVALGAYSIADRPSTVSVGQPGYERQITNVAPGVYDTDAVNMSQLRSLDYRVNRLGAMAFAFSALAPMGYDPKEPTQYSAGIGNYNGTTALAVGVYHYTRPDVMLNAAIAMSSGGDWEKSARFGVTWKTGGPKRKEVSPAMPTINDSSPEAKNDITERVKKILAEYDS